ncbi:inositol phoshorylceramide synthase regulatory subunit Kei1 [Schizosaccharomyces cryophilus OY26]|uniref:Inositol phoshorylceramide synthase regulatory subunit Kei1 n=1 Tax=Schizosaccharomyces cryophilus (strain OY26 / ATCC MYA-4695 / CBS 11777 / NBRC 106824 / NRRL Y48691) TaxID=653667 RepID=S9XC84_SCHCR|nr:inositol phoshorylceramide synthase regulatory subunit Kei1 [Schizosaccharomyces cryophilus OY26]EPY51426.1 inositol phoshorylceramide synthase regulatory subunit Kei1 [Schizosaccharomyces cryophilus OY26]
MVSFRRVRWSNLLEQFFLPRSLFGLCSLRVGCEVIVWFAIINKLSGLYGIVSLFQSSAVSAWQIFMYMTSIFTLVLFSWLAVYIPRDSVPHALILFYSYAIDFILNMVFTVLFALSWFAKMLTSTQSAQGVPDSQQPTSLWAVFFEAESIPSLLLLTFFTSLKLYFTLITLSYSNKLIVDSGIRPQTLPSSFMGRLTRILMKPYIIAANRTYLRNHAKRFLENIELQQRLMDEIV